MGDCEYMKVVILAGGLGTRISEESHLKPKPMIEIGEMPILVHIMKIFSAQGYNEFIICAGYKQRVIKEYFANLALYTNDVTIDMKTGGFTFYKKDNLMDNWKITIVDTGLKTQTGGRIKRVKDYIGNEPFFLTYGDAVGDIDLLKLLECHKKAHKIGTISVYNFGQSKGIVEVNESGAVGSFREKSKNDGDLINIGYMVMEPKVFDYIDGDEIAFEDIPMKRLVQDNELNAYIHNGYWQCMDTLNEKNKLEAMWASNNAPWKVWEE